MASPHPLSPAAPVPSRRNLAPLVLLGGLLLGVVAIVVVVVTALNRPGSAGDVAAEFVVATYEGDLTTACGLMTPEFAAEQFARLGADTCEGLVRAAEQEADLPPSGTEATDIEVLEAQESGDSASVRISSPTGSPGVWVRVDLVRQDDQWLVSDFSG